MANNPLPYDATVQASVDAVAALLNNGFLDIYQGSQPALNGAVSGTLLVSMQFSNPAFPPSSSLAGTTTATANAISTGVAGNSGTAQFFVLYKADHTTVWGTGTCGVGAGFDLNMTTTTITFGGTVSCSGFTITELET